jgi:hypothetical protein
MPIRRERYPVNWPALAASLKGMVDWICQECDKECRKPDEPYDGFERTLTVAHVWPEDHAPDAPVVSVMMLCGQCHLNFDAPLTAAKRHAYERRYNLRWEELYL